MNAGVVHGTCRTETGKDYRQKGGYTIRMMIGVKFLSIILPSRVMALRVLLRVTRLALIPKKARKALRRSMSLNSN